MENILIQDFVKNELKINDPVRIAEVAEKIEFRDFRKGDILTQQGDKNPPVRVLFNGIVRGFHINSDGDEFTDCFIYQPMMPMVSTVGLQNTATVSIQAITSGSYFETPLHQAIILLRDIPEVQNYYQQKMRMSFEYHIDIKKMLYGKTGIEKLNWFAINYPSLIQIIPQKDIASFLGITKEHMSRIRNEWKKQR